MRKWLNRAPAGMPCWIGVVNQHACRSGGYAPPNLFTQHVGSGPASPGTTLRAWCALLPDDTAVGYVGTTTKLYQYDGASTFTDKSVGGGYTNTATDWSFAQFGAYTLATNRVDAVQVRDATGSSAFANCGGSPPKARIIVTQSDQVLLFDLNDGAEKGNAFAVCAPGDHTDWSSANATTATPIRHRPGKITAAVAFRDYVLAFKRSSVYKLTYTGATFKWRVELIAVGRGAWGKHDVVNCGDIIVFNGPGGSWAFDGASFRDISEWHNPFRGATMPSIGSFYSPVSGRAYFIALLAGTSFYSAYSYNLVSEAWGTQQFLTTADDITDTHQVVLTGESAALDVFTGGKVGATFPDYIWAFNLSENPSVYEADTNWGNGGSFSSSLSASLVGKGHGELMKFTRVSPVFTSAAATDVPATPDNTELTLSWYAFNSELVGASFANAVTSGSGVASSTDQRRMDLLVSAVYLRPSITINSSGGYCEIGDVIVDYTPAGRL